MTFAIWSPPNQGRSQYISGKSSNTSSASRVANLRERPANGECMAILRDQCQDRIGADPGSVAVGSVHVAVWVYVNGALVGSGGHYEYADTRYIV
jgi:hypothetical protein